MRRWRRRVWSFFEVRRRCRRVARARRVSTCARVARREEGREELLFPAARLGLAGDFAVAQLVAGGHVDAAVRSGARLADELAARIGGQC